MTHPIETEVKIPLTGLGAIRERLLEQGFRPAVPDQTERSVLWDRDGELFRQGSALRLRQYASATRLTWKGPKLEDPTFKIRPELETGVEDARVMEAILRQLGFSPVMTMEKRREILQREGLVACLDEAPFGCYLELEGERGLIHQALGELGLAGAPVETRSYPSLFREHGLG
nr:class IV adenylate cyclase [uncultured Holophaga sp.]